MGPHRDLLGVNHEHHAHYEASFFLHPSIKLTQHDASFGGGGLFESKKGELMDAVRARGLHAALYFSLYEWFHPLYKGPNPHQYVEQVCKNKQHMDIISKERERGLMLLWFAGSLTAVLFFSCFFVLFAR